MKIITTRVQIPLWDVGVCPSDETVKTEVPYLAAIVALTRTLTAKNSKC
jgi:hypothetical protein